MSSPEFRFVETARLRAHEEVRDRDVAALVERLRREGRLAEPLWVARGSDVILNGHHRARALPLLGVRWVPAWVFDYESDPIDLGRWGPGPPITKREVIARALEGRLYPPKTTKHTLRLRLPRRPTVLAELMGARPPQERASERPEAGSAGRPSPDPR
ncbi:MAG: ParB N-terminal domain-containing protein [Thermoplasmata archaeon]|nr:ParB N-terminal domain-containing protein [Thermoplasmata archaeon]